MAVIMLAAVLVIVGSPVLLFVFAWRDAATQPGAPPRSYQSDRERRPLTDHAAEEGER